MVARLLAKLTYFGLILPIGLLGSPFVDPLRIKQPPRDTNWQPVEPAEISLERARRQS